MHNFNRSTEAHIRLFRLLLIYVLMGSIWLLCCISGFSFLLDGSTSLAQQQLPLQLHCGPGPALQRVRLTYPWDALATSVKLFQNVSDWCACVDMLWYVVILCAHQQVMWRKQRRLSLHRTLGVASQSSDNASKRSSDLQQCDYVTVFHLTAFRKHFQQPERVWANKSFDHVHQCCISWLARCLIWSVWSIICRIYFVALTFPSQDGNGYVSLGIWNFLPRGKGVWPSLV